MAEDEGPVPDSLLPYDRWAREASLHVMIRALAHVAETGLPGGHHFYVTFKTGYPGVVIPDRLRAQYPDEMTIVLQHQFSNLKMDEQAKVLSVGLSFSGIASTLVIPAAAITAFVDPEVRFGLSFEVELPGSGLPAPAGSAAPSEPAARPDAPAEIVSLDAFRRRPKE
jgi:hypothetical protein